MPNVRESLEVLRRHLRLCKVNVDVDFRDIIRGNPCAFVDIYRYLFDQYSPEVASFLLENDFHLSGTSDQKCMETIYRVCRDALDMKPVLSLTQFFTNGFPQKKMQMVVDIVKAVVILRGDLQRRQTSNGLRLSRALSARPGAIRRLRRSNSPRSNFGTFNLGPSPQCHPASMQTNHRPSSDTLDHIDTTFRVQLGTHDGNSSPNTITPPTSMPSPRPQVPQNFKNNIPDRQTFKFHPQILLKQDSKTSGISIQSDDETPESNTQEVSQHGDSFFVQTGEVPATLVRRQDSKATDPTAIDGFRAVSVHDYRREKRLEQAASPHVGELLTTISQQIETLVARVGTIEERMRSVERKSKMSQQPEEPMVNSGSRLMVQQSQQQCRPITAGDDDAETVPVRDVGKFPITLPCEELDSSNWQSICAPPGDTPVSCVAARMALVDLKPFLKTTTSFANPPAASRLCLPPALSYPEDSGSVSRDIETYPKCSFYDGDAFQPKNTSYAQAIGTASREAPILRQPYRLYDETSYNSAAVTDIGHSIVSTGNYPMMSTSEGNIAIIDGPSIYQRSPSPRRNNFVLKANMSKQSERYARYDCDVRRMLRARSPKFSRLPKSQASNHNANPQLVPDRPASATQLGSSSLSGMKPPLPSSGGNCSNDLKQAHVEGCFHDEENLGLSGKYDLREQVNRISSMLAKTQDLLNPSSGVLYKDTLQLVSQRSCTAKN